VEPQVEAPEGKGTSGTYSKSSQLAKEGYHIGGEPNPIFDLQCKAPAKLQHEVRRLFERTDVDEWTRNHKAGALNVHALPTIATGSDRLFKRRFEKDGIDSAVVILVDVSWSMFYDRNNRDAKRIRNAVATCNALLDTLSRAGVKTAVVTFGDETSVLKPFSMNVAQAKKRIMQVASAGSTNDYFAVRYCHEMLLRRTEERKLLFVLTDGEGDTYETRQQVKSGERLGITTIGVGLQLDVSNVYDNNIHVENTADLGGASFKQIKLAA
jgi:nitric oxide reductase activation protein